MHAVQGHVTSQLNMEVPRKNNNRWQNTLWFIIVADNLCTSRSSLSANCLAFVAAAERPYLVAAFTLSIGNGAEDESPAFF